MKKLTLLSFVAFLFIAQVGCSQHSVVQYLNLDFEQHTNGFPSKWRGYGGAKYKIYVDSDHAKNGKFSAVIENTGEESKFRTLTIALPSNYQGDSIRLSGYIKTENVTEGYAGLWINIEPKIGYNGMVDKGVKGTTNWTKYEITLALKPEATNKIEIGGILVGKGKMWLDHLHVSIDGKELDDPDLKIYKQTLAVTDKEFDLGSGIVFSNQNKVSVDNLDLLGKIWGFLKYHHPEVAKGNYNWDYELFRFLPQYLKVNNDQQRDGLLIAWIEKYGKPVACANCKPTSDKAVLAPDLSWLDESNLSDHLKQLLKGIYNNRNQGGNYYVTLTPNIFNPLFINEKSYEGMSYPDGGFRLLSLYRYWNMVEYFSPNRHLTDKKWHSVLKEYISKFLDAKDRLAYELAVLQLIGEINDGHAALKGANKIFEWRGDFVAPFKIEFVENKPVVVGYLNSGFSSKAKLKIGDIITHIDGRAVESIVDSLKPYYPASNEISILRGISADLLRSRKNTIQIKYISANHSKQEILSLYEKRLLASNSNTAAQERIKSFKLLEGNIGYISLGDVTAEDIPEIKKAFKNTKGIIADSRKYPKTSIVFPLGSYFVTEPTTFVKISHGNPDNPGEFTFRDGPKIISDGNKYKGKLVVLVNEKSQSAAEYIAMAFRAVKNATVVGSTTAGADGNISEIPLPGGLTTLISGIGVYYPDGRPTQRIGIVPDVVVKPTIEGIKNKKDEVLLKAIEIINR